MLRLVCALVLGLAVPSSDGEARVTVKVEAKNVGARVSIDGHDTGATPISTAVEAGAHTIELTWNGGRSTTEVSLRAGDHQIVVLGTSPVAAVATIIVEVPGTLVTIDGEPQGEAPVAAEVSPGEHRVTLTWPDGRVSTRRVTLRAGDRTALQRRA